jgi:hypothetical protein
MESERKGENDKVETPDQKKEVIIFVNSREKAWSEKAIDYEQVIILAFGSISSNPDISYSVTYKKGNNDRPEGIMVQGDSVKVKDGMRFNVTQTNRS